MEHVRIAPGRFHGVLFPPPNLDRQGEVRIGVTVWNAIYRNRLNVCWVIKAKLAQ